MRNNYKKLGNYIRQVDIRNTDGKEDNLLGVSVQKIFIPSIANTVGTDFTKYKVVKKGQFTYIPDTSRRGDKIGIALLEDYDEGLVSNVYTVFEIIDENLLNAKYLMLWFSRPEFDRYARYKSHGSVREIMDWEGMCNVMLPVPSIEEQKRIVDAYEIIERRIDIKKKINDNLSQQAICIIQKTKEQDSVAGKPWSLLTVQDLVDRSYIASPMDGNHGEIHPKVSDYVASGVPFIMANNLNDGYVDYENCAFITEQQANTLRKGFAKPKDVLITHKATLGRTAIVSNEYKTTILTPQVTYYRALNYISPEFLRYFFETSEFQKNFEAWAGAGSTRAYIGITKQLELPILLPGEDSMRTITESISKIEAMRYNNHLEIIKLSNMQKILLSEISSR